MPLPIGSIVSPGIALAAGGEAVDVAFRHESVGGVVRKEAGLGGDILMLIRS